MPFWKPFRKAPEFKRTRSRVQDEVALSPRLEENLSAIRRSIGEAADLVIRYFGQKPIAAVVYLETLVDGAALAAHVVDPINRHLQSEPGALKTDRVKTLLAAPKVIEIGDLHHLIGDLLAGQAVILVRDDVQALTVTFPGFPRRPIGEPKTEQSVRAPREGFNEVLEDNLGILRRGIQDPNLRLEVRLLGERSKTRTALLYINDVANPDIVKEVRKRLDRIDYDGIIDSAYVRQLISDTHWTVFPLVQETERPDRVTSGLLEGRVAILVDKSPFALIVPVTANEMYQTSEDFFIQFLSGSFIRLVRFVGTVSSVTLPGLYAAIVGVNPFLLPADFIQIIASGRTQVPVPVVFETFFVLLLYEIFREAVIRMPRNVNLILGIAAGVIVGNMAVFSGLVAGATLIIVIIAAIASFATASPEMEQGWRLCRYIFLFAGGAFGLPGIISVGILMLCHMASLKSFGVSYLEPWAPPIAYDLLDTIVTKPRWANFRRPPTYRPQQEDRLDYTPGEDDASD